MPETAQAQVPRLVELLAWLSQGHSAKPVTYRAAARRLGGSEQTIRADLDALFGLSEEHRVAREPPDRGRRRRVRRS